MTKRTRIQDVDFYFASPLAIDINSFDWSLLSDSMGSFRLFSDKIMAKNREGLRGAKKKIYRCRIKKLPRKHKLNQDTPASDFIHEIQLMIDNAPLEIKRNAEKFASSYGMLGRTVHELFRQGYAEHYDTSIFADNMVQYFDKWGYIEKVTNPVTYGGTLDAPFKHMDKRYVAGIYNMDCLEIDWNDFEKV